MTQHAAARGFELFYPQLRVKPVNPRACTVKSDFPGYLFVRADMNVTGLSTFLWMPYALGLVCFGGVAAEVPEVLVAALRRHLEAVNVSGGEAFAKLKAGAPVLITDGPFEGHAAIFDVRLGGNERVRVLLNLLGQRRVPLELRVGQIRPVDSRR